MMEELLRGMMPRLWHLVMHTHPRVAWFAISIAPYRQCSAGGVRPAEDFGESIVDTAICAKPGKVLAGQLLYGDSIHRTYFVLT